jgi:hypothetical protein
MKFTLTTILLFVFNLFCLSSNLNYKEIKISFGEKINIQDLNENCLFEIFGFETQIKGVGNELNDFVFFKPGNFEIKIVENVNHDLNSCDHKHFPEKIIVKVSPIKFTFHFDEILFSSAIHVGVKTDNITLKIPVTIDVFENSTIDYNFSIVNTSGLKTNIKGTLLENVILKSGKQILTYNLSGQVQSETYIMFDFMDYNGNVVVYNHPNPIK